MLEIGRFGDRSLQSDHISSTSDTAGSPTLSEPWLVHFYFRHCSLISILQQEAFSIWRMDCMCRRLSRMGESILYPGVCWFDIEWVLCFRIQHVYTPPTDSTASQDVHDVHHSVQIAQYSAKRRTLMVCLTSRTCVVEIEIL